MDYLQISISVNDPALQEILIARMESEGYEGFEQLEDRLHAFIPQSGFDPVRLELILQEWSLSYTSQHLASRNWNEEWEKHFDPVIVEDFCVIRAAFHPPIPGLPHELVITPKMSFGTGHHATTYMMVAAMRDLDFRNKRVLDFGTGTGVLAILAEKLGAAHILAIDHDQWSIDNATENLLENHCSRITLQLAEQLPTDEPFDIILANINKNVILSQLASMRQQLSTGGVILLSGLLEDDLQDIEKEVVKNNFSISGRMTKGNWICLKVEFGTKN